MNYFLTRLASVFGIGATYYAFFLTITLIEKYSTPVFKRELANVICNSTIFTVWTKLPIWFLRGFDAVFTTHLWSYRGSFRSMLASLGTVFILLMFWFSTIPDNWHVRLAKISRSGTTQSTWYMVAIPQSPDVSFNLDIDRNGQLHQIPNPNYLGPPTPTTFTALQLQRVDTFFLLPLIYNVLADFLALNITRFTLTRLSQLDTAPFERVVISIGISTMAIVVLSVGVLYIDFKIMDYILRLAYDVTAAPPPERLVLSFRDALLFPFYKKYPALLGNWSERTLYGVFVWSTLMGIFWMVGFGLSLLVASISVRLRSVGPWLEKRFKVRSQPFGILKIFVLIPAVAIHYIFAS